MSDSEDDLSTPANIPPDSEIESCLRRIVRDAIKSGNDITVNVARLQAETELGLAAGFFKDNDVWKKRSKDVINQAVDEPESPEKPKVKEPEAKAGMKRKSDEAQPKKKRLKKSPVIGATNREEPDAAEEAPIEKSSRVEQLKSEKEQTKSEDESALSDPPDDESEPSELRQNGKPNKEDDDESDLSSVIDEPAPKKSRQTKKSTAPTATKSKPNKPAKVKGEKVSKAKPEKPGKDLTPDEEEVKRLQSWLMKCGIRKVWHRELAPYATPKEKITHLKKMLNDVGMTPRYSAEKARQIKEARELKAELEAAREFNEQWGDGGGSDDDNGDGGEKKKDAEKFEPVRRLKPKGLVDFGDSDEESE